MRARALANWRTRGQVDAMKEVADAYKKRSIHDFERVYAKYKSRELSSLLAQCSASLMSLVAGSKRA